MMGLGRHKGVVSLGEQIRMRSFNALTVAMPQNFVMLGTAPTVEFNIKPLGGQALIEEMCVRVGLSPIELSNLGYSWNLRAHVDTQPTPEMAQAFLQAAQPVLQNNKRLAADFNAVKEILTRQHRIGQIAAAVGVGVVGAIAYLSSSPLIYFFSLSEQLEYIATIAAAGTGVGASLRYFARDYYAAAARDRTEKLAVDLNQEVLRFTLARIDASAMTQLIFTERPWDPVWSGIVLASDTVQQIAHMADITTRTKGIYAVDGRDFTGGYGFGLHFHMNDPLLAHMRFELHVAQPWVDRSIAADGSSSGPTKPPHGGRRKRQRPKILQPMWEMPGLQPS